MSTEVDENFTHALPNVETVNKMSDRSRYTCTLIFPAEAKTTRKMSTDVDVVG